MHKFRIEMTAPNRGKVWIDDIHIQGVKEVSFSASTDTICEVKLTLNAASVDASGEFAKAGE